MPPRRFQFALAASLALHAAVLGEEAVRRLLAPAPPAAAPALQATLRIPPRPEPVAEPLLKNTLDETEPETAAPKPPPPPRHSEAPAKAKATPPAKLKAAQKKLAEHLFYPEEAVARGLEGEVRLLLVLDADGRVLEAQVASSSGHALLDQAAVRAAYAMGRIGNDGKPQMILPVVFSLQ